METFIEYISQLEHWQISVLAFWFLFQGMVFTIFPEEVIIAGLGALCANGKMHFVEAFLVIAAGLIPANSGSYAIGYFFGHRFAQSKRMIQAADLVRTKGVWVVFFMRFIPLVRGPVYLACGACRLPWRKFVIMDSLALCIQVPALLLLGRNASLIFAWPVWLKVTVIGLLVLAFNRLMKWQSSKVLPKAPITRPLPASLPL